MSWEKTLRLFTDDDKTKAKEAVGRAQQAIRKLVEERGGNYDAACDALWELHQQADKLIFEIDPREGLTRKARMEAWKRFILSGGKQPLDDNPN